MWWFQQGLSILPVALVLCSATAFVVPYVTAVLLRHVDPLVPYISDTGTIPPERCLFGILLNVSALLGVATVFVHYKYVCVLNPENPGILRLNRLGLALGWSSCFGLCIIANFQKCVLYSVHVLGASVTFGTGALYMLAQTALSFQAQPRRARPRLALLLWAGCSGGSSILVFVSSVLLGSGIYGPGLVQKLHWQPQERGYIPHMISTISEWSLAFSFLSFFLTYIQDFQTISLRAVVTLQGHPLQHSPQSPENEEQGLLFAGSI
ncbi:DRAM2 protein, partial [Sclerurus mexicanus]|nr:DRAM2 protein [Sclerurus mexicanus]